MKKSFLLIYSEFSIYLKYVIPQVISKIVKMWQKVDVSGNFYDGEHYLFHTKEVCEVPCVKMFF